METKLTQYKLEILPSFATSRPYTLYRVNVETLEKLPVAQGWLSDLHRILTNMVKLDFIVRACSVCGLEFLPYKSIHYVCSVVCRNKRDNKNKVEKIREEEKEVKKKKNYKGVNRDINKSYKVDYEVKEDKEYILKQAINEVIANKDNNKIVCLCKICKQTYKDVGRTNICDNCLFSINSAI